MGSVDVKTIVKEDYDIGVSEIKQGSNGGCHI